jgi:cytochrome c oxidase subunit 4
MTAVEEHEYAEMNVEAGHHTHPSDWTYIKVAIVLAVMTGVEVALSYTKINEHLTIGMLLFLAALKFGTVVAFFMHLKFDHPWFRRLFVTGLVLAIGVYIAYMSTLHFYAPTRH